MLILKNLLFTALVPGTVTVVVPYWLLTPDYEALPFDLGLFRYTGVLLIGIGAALYCWCLWHYPRKPARSASSAFYSEMIKTQTS